MTISLPLELSYSYDTGWCCNSAQVPISVLVVPEHPSDLEITNPVTKNNFEITLLIGANYYWQFVGDHIICGDGPTAM